ncbi:EVE domain-containing protein [Iodobacter sp.]|uniref:EVE domain-containing protein n=1 Tax=Iodobacter sp. TaxID=1915058 RepID=UPI0025E4F32F|nr:EVE domain-containing protein [Iodobacter sp.]
MNYWLMKSEPDEVSIDDLAACPEQTVGWYGVRNYQARNFMRDKMQLGDRVFFYHSSCKEPGIAGLAKVDSCAYPDPTQFDTSSEYFDSKSTQESPRWQQVDVRFIQKTRLLSLNELRGYPELAEMLLLKKGSRLSITPVAAQDAAFILEKLAC